jgi:hypothetical protein
MVVKRTGSRGLVRAGRWLFDNRIKHMAQFVEEITSSDLSRDGIRDRLLESFHKKKRDALKLMRARIVVLFLLYISLTATAVSSIFIGVNSLPEDSPLRQVLLPVLRSIVSVLGWAAVSLGGASVMLSLLLLFLVRAISLVETDMLMIAMQLVARVPRECLVEHKIYDDDEPRTPSEAGAAGTVKR